MKLITISGPPSSGKTSVILRLIESLREGGMEKIGVVKFDCLTSFDQVRYREAGIPVEIGFSGKVCPDHFFISNIEDAVKWGVKSGFDMLVTESAGLCNRCSPHISEIPAVCVIDNLGNQHAEKNRADAEICRLCGNHKRGYRLSGRAGGL